MAGLCGLSGPVGILPFNFIVVCTRCAFLERVPRFKRIFVSKVGRRLDCLSNGF